MTQAIVPYLLYEDCAAALDWLARAFGFEETLRFTGDEGYVNHAEMRLGEGIVYLGDPGEQYRNPRQVGHETVGIHVTVDDVDAHFARARQAGATVVGEPKNEHGTRFYRAVDLEGHRWIFAIPHAGDGG